MEEIAKGLMTLFAQASGFRIRGGLFGKNIGWGATTARFCAWALPTTATIALWFNSSLFDPYWFQYEHLILFFFATWLGAIGPWWKSLDLGRREGTWLVDFILHSVRGTLWTLPIAAVFVLYGHLDPALILLAGGTLCGLVYELGYKLPTPFQINRYGGLNQGPELGEFLYGATIGLTIIVASYTI